MNNQIKDALSNILGINDVIKDNRLLYVYVRGSHLYGLNISTSDEDLGGCYIASLNDVLSDNVTGLLQDEKHDNTLYEVSSYIKFLAKGNPNIVESLFVPEHLIKYKHPLMEEIFKYRNKFLTKKFVNAAAKMAMSQIYKARGLKTKIVNPVYERKGILDFCYTTYNQGSTNIQHWLTYRFLFQEYCGCVNIPNMVNTVGVYYDWKRFFTDYNFTDLFKRSLKAAKDSKQPSYYIDELKKLNNGEMPARELGNTNKKIADLYEQYDNSCINELIYFLYTEYKLTTYNKLQEFVDYYLNKDYEPYSGMVNKDGTSNELRLSSVPKGEKPICIMTFNKNGYSEHCKEYKEYKNWVEHRNPARYESNLNKNYDSKNLMHAFRLFSMAIELANTGQVNINREHIDREFLLDIRNHKFEYDELMTKLDELKQELDKALETSLLPDDTDVTFLNELCVNIRKKYYGIN